MKRIHLYHGVTCVLILVLLAAACRTTDPCCDDIPPAVPAGVWSVTGDGYVEILWSPVREDDLAGYNIYRSRSEWGTYELIGGSGDNDYIDWDVDNGITYFYAVTSYDWDDNESELSYESVFDTPRPAGHDLVIHDVDELAGVDFSGFYDNMIHPWDDPFVDMYLLWLDGRYALSSTDVEVGGQVYGTDIQYAGYVSSLDEIDWAPDGGWSTETADTVTLFEGHGYLVWTWENHFAKFRVEHIGYDYVVIDWAFQVDEGNPELVIMAAGDNPSAAIGKEARDVAAGYRLPSARPSRSAGGAGGDWHPERRD